MNTRTLSARPAADPDFDLEQLTPELGKTRQQLDVFTTRAAEEQQRGATLERELAEAETALGAAEVSLTPDPKAVAQARKRLEQVTQDLAGCRRRGAACSRAIAELEAKMVQHEATGYERIEKRAGERRRPILKRQADALSELLSSLADEIKLRDQIERALPRRSDWDEPGARVVPPGAPFSPDERAVLRGQLRAWFLSVDKMLGGIAS